MTQITEKALREAGYKAEIFFYQTGGGEDEDDCIIFVKDGRVLHYEYVEKYWMAAKYDDLNYTEGWPYEAAQRVQFVEEIEIKLP